MTFTLEGEGFLYYMAPVAEAASQWANDVEEGPAVVTFGRELAEMHAAVAETKTTATEATGSGPFSDTAARLVDSNKASAGKLEEGGVEEKQENKYKELFKPLLDYAKDTQGENAMEDVLQNLGTKIPGAIIAERERGTRAGEPGENITEHDTDAAMTYSEKITKHLEILGSQWWNLSSELRDRPVAEACRLQISPSTTIR